MNWKNVSWTVFTDDGKLSSAIRKDLADAVGAHVRGPITLAEIATASTTGSALPPGFDAVATFALPGSTRFGAWLALDPAGGHVLAGQTLEPAPLARLLGEALDTTLRTPLGATADPSWDAEARPEKSAELVLVRLRFRDADGLEAMPVAGLPAEAVRTIAARVAAAPGATASAVPDVRPLALGELAPLVGGSGSHGIDVLLGVNLRVTVEIGRTELPIRDVLAWTPGSIVELDKLAGEKVDVLVNGHRIALGEVVVVDDNFGVRVTDVVAAERAMIPAAARG